jgi:DNA adenine methylase
MKPIVNLKPLVKYQGGKSKELPIIKQLLPPQFSRVLEPFCGGAAVSFGLGYPALMSDINRDVINLYSVVANEKLYPDLQHKVNVIKTLEHDDLQVEFYGAREAINQPWDCVDPLQRALSYIIVRQLCFSGMERYNAKGEFNVPFGHYKTFSCNLSPDHHKFLKKECAFRYGSFTALFDQINADDFIFIDPPYLERLGYTEGDGGLKLHEDLLGCLKTTKGKWMIIHSDHEFYRESYKDFNIIEKDFAYAQRFGKDLNKSEAPQIDTFIENGETENSQKKKVKPLKDHSGAKVKHLYITNY